MEWCYSLQSQLLHSSSDQLLHLEDSLPDLEQVINILPLKTINNLQQTKRSLKEELCSYPQSFISQMTHK